MEICVLHKYFNLFNHIKIVIKCMEERVKIVTEYPSKILSSLLKSIFSKLSFVFNMKHWT